MIEQEKDFFDGFPISADEIVKLENTAFEIQHAEDELLEDFKDKSKMVKKTKLKVELSDGAIVSYYPNMTSLRTIVNKLGRDYSKWEHSKWSFEVKPIEFGTMKGKNSLFVCEAKGLKASLNMPKRPVQGIK